MLTSASASLQRASGARRAARASSCSRPAGDPAGRRSPWVWLALCRARQLSRSLEVQDDQGLQRFARPAPPQGPHHLDHELGLRFHRWPNHQGLPAAVASGGGAKRDGTARHDQACRLPKLRGAWASGERRHGVCCRPGPHLALCTRISTEIDALGTARWSCAASGTMRKALKACTVASRVHRGSASLRGGVLRRRTPAGPTHAPALEENGTVRTPEPVAPSHSIAQHGSHAARKATKQLTLRATRTAAAVLLPPRPFAATLACAPRPAPAAAPAQRRDPRACPLRLSVTTREQRTHSTRDAPRAAAGRPGPACGRCACDGAGARPPAT